MILRTLRSGYYSVMYDGGHFPLEENIKGATYIAEIAHGVGAVVEAELGQFGGEGQGGRVEMASPEEAKRMVEESGIDTLAVAVGSAHGQSSRLDLRLLEEIAEVTPAPLVLHGGSGIHPDGAKIIGLRDTHLARKRWGPDSPAPHLIGTPKNSGFQLLLLRRIPCPREGILHGIPPITNHQSPITIPSSPSLDRMTCALALWHGRYLPPTGGRN